jgi:hypothetical protein
VAFWIATFSYLAMSAQDRARSRKRPPAHFEYYTSDSDTESDTAASPPARSRQDPDPLDSWEDAQRSPTIVPETPPPTTESRSLPDPPSSSTDEVPETPPSRLGSPRKRSRTETPSDSAQSTVESLERELSDAYTTAVRSAEHFDRVEQTLRAALWDEREPDLMDRAEKIRSGVEQTHMKQCRAVFDVHCRKIHRLKKQHEAEVARLTAEHEAEVARLEAAKDDELATIRDQAEASFVKEYGLVRDEFGAEIAAKIREIRKESRQRREGPARPHKYFLQ